MRRCAARAEARAGFYKIRAGLGRGLAGVCLFVVGEVAGLDDDLYERAVCSVHHGLDVLVHPLKIAGLGRADVDDHVDFFRAVCNGVLCFKGLGLGGIGAQGEADDRAGLYARALQQRRGLLDVHGVDAHRSRADLHGFLADFFNISRGGKRLEQGVVHHAGEFFSGNVHGFVLLNHGKGEDIRRADCVMACITGRQKAQAIYSALRNELIDILVIDSLTAEEIMRIAEAERSA